GVLGETKAYYGCVEAQGQGTLHCHMIIWIEGGLNPKELQERLQSADGNEFSKRLVNYLENIIWNHVPPTCDDPLPGMNRGHPDSHRGFDLSLEGDELGRYRAQDLHNLMYKNQCHKHTDTCYKYCRNGPRECHFDLDIDNLIPETTVDTETGELMMRILDGMVNNYNPTILEAMRCNMDIQYIGSGEEAKAVLYYIKDCITKSPLKAHVAYAALELAMKKLADNGVTCADGSAEYTRRLLQQTAFSILSSQELSAQQVMSYLLDFEDHFTSHKFANLYWPSFERLIDKSFP
ncbi:hypothetical protein PYCCODRAFT_1352521, partial [Trametes coccinea BRFM310]